MVDYASIVQGITTGLAVICTALRFYTRVHIKAGISWDDWWILAGLLLTILTGGLLLYGVGVDPIAEKAIRMAVDTKMDRSFNTSPHITYLKLSYASSILYFTIVTSIKISILLMYRRIFSIDKNFRFQSLLVGILVLSFWLVASLATVLNCVPIKYNWIGISRPEHCFNFNIFWMVTGAVEVLIDSIVLALPIRMVMGLQLSRKRKLSIVFVFLLGGFVIITGIVRVIYGYIPGSRIPEYTKSGLWSTVHIVMGIVCACLPTLRPLFTSFTSFVTNSSSTMRRRYYSVRGRYPKDEGSASDSGIGSKTRDPIESLPLRRMDCRCGGGIAGVRASRARIEAGPRPMGRHDDDCYCGDAIMKDTRMEIEVTTLNRQRECSCGANSNASSQATDIDIVVLPSLGPPVCCCGAGVKSSMPVTETELVPLGLERSVCYCGAGLKDPRVDTVWLKRERGW